MACPPSSPRPMNSNSDSIIHTGGCHCRAVTWKVQALKSVTTWTCNCSNCSMRGNTHFIVLVKDFHLLSGRSNITTYTFGTHIAKHTFCSVCGITSIFTPRTNPNEVGVTLACVDPGTITLVEAKSFDGVNWEDAYAQLNSACSK